MPKSADQSEADAIFNRASLALAKSQRLIASWLPPKTEEDVKTEEQLEAEEREIFTVVPERLGLGAPLPEDGETPSKTPNSADSKLRKQLLGAKSNKSAPQYPQAGRDKSRKPAKDTKHVQSKARPPQTQLAHSGSQDDAEDLEEGRTKIMKTAKADH
ncbi:MAG: hypothetical protein Q9227_007066 [Pyrenula ochraceoflavens]